MTPPFERITIIGLGLLGGSIALAAKSRRIAARIVESLHEVRELIERAAAVA